MNTTLRITLWAGCAMLLAGCSDRGVHRLTEEELQGTLALTLRTDATVVSVLTESQTKGIAVDAQGELVFSPELAPKPEDCRVEITTPDGEVVKSWASFADMPKTVRLKEGDYRLTASYGADRQGGAFDQLRLQGATDFRVERQKVNPVSVICSVADVLLTAEYTEGFKNYFEDYSLVVYSGSNQPFTIAGDEPRVACLEPGNISTALNLTRLYDGERFTLPGPDLGSVEAGEFYRLRIDVGDDGAGGVHLLLTFDEQTEEEPIRVQVSAEALAGPFYTVDGFTSGDIIELGEGQVYTDNLSALVTARGMIASCVVSTTSPQLRAKGWPVAGFELVGISQADKTALKNFGFSWTEGLAGLNMAVLNFKGLAGQMPAGSAQTQAHEISVVTTDRDGKQSDPLLLTFQVTPPQFELFPIAGALRPTVKKSNNSTYFVSVTNGNPEKIFFEYYNPVWNNWTPVASTLGNLAAQGYRFTVRDIDWSWASVRIRVGYQGRDQYSEIVQEGVMPSISTFSLRQAYCYSALVRPSGPGVEAKYFSADDYSLEISSDGGASWAPKEMGMYLDGSFAYITVDELLPGQGYTLRLTYDPKLGLTPATREVTLTTEVPQYLTNGSFDTGWSTTDYTGVVSGGRTASWYGGFIGIGAENRYADAPTRTVTDLQVEGWANVNAKTIPAGAANQNSWYMVPSTVQVTGYEGFGVLVRSVGWNAAGDAVADNVAYTAAGAPANANSPVPPAGLNRSAGKLYLSEGGYSYDHTTGTETYNHGIPFTARPAKLTGYYRYTPLGDDKGMVRVDVMRNTTVLATSTVELTGAEAYRAFEVPLTYSSNNKATHLRVMFASSTRASDDQSTENSAVVTNPDVVNLISVGSELYIDQIELEYQ